MCCLFRKKNEIGPEIRFFFENSAFLSERGEFIKIEEVPKSASEISELNEERKRRSHEKEEETKWNMRMRDWNGQDTVVVRELFLCVFKVRKQIIRLIQP